MYPTKVYRKYGISRKTYRIVRGYRKKEKRTYHHQHRRLLKKAIMNNTDNYPKSSTCLQKRTCCGLFRN